MFYSQFILAKKGPLGTIWIAAHLERKLRKNQVADTDIGVSVDSILFPEVPIALRLSSHLLLGVVRIYSRKVNYLFDDCSEALLKIKQAFRSTAVDLPPEESTAPYNSITLPETFDLDDFELPDNEIFQGNYVDHHVSTREQITLQDAMEGVVYSTSQFGLDERFGDGDTSQIGLDFDEDLFLGQAAAQGNDGISSSDPQALAPPTTPLEKLEVSEGVPETSETAQMNGTENQNEVLAANTEFVTYAQAPSTPGLFEEPNLSNVQEAMACNDHMDLEDHSLSNLPVPESTENVCSELGPRCEDIAINLPENGHNLRDVDMKQKMPPVQEQIKPVSPALQCSKGMVGALDFPNRVEDINSGIVINSEPTVLFTEKNDEQCLEPVGIRLDETVASPSCSQVTSELEESARKISSGATYVQEPEDYMEDQQTSLKSEIQNDITIPIDTGETCTPNNVDSFDTATHKKMASAVCVLQGCNSYPSHHSVLSPSDKTAETPCNLSSEGLQFKSVDNAVSCDNQVDVLDGSATTDLLAPEKFLSIPEGLTAEPSDLPVESTPEKEVFGGDSGGGAGTKLITGQKRSSTESCTTVQSLKSVESFGEARGKRTADSIPDDDDLLSSILVGRRSSVLKLKSTPPVPEMKTTKRSRTAVRSTGSKRKVLIDDTMVLHGDTIRQQLTHTEDIRRVRKKAPCTRPEISLIQRQNLEDEIFIEPIFTGLSAELIFLHTENCDLSRTRFSEDDQDNASDEVLKDVQHSVRSSVTKRTEIPVSTEPVTIRDDSEAQTDIVNETENQGMQDHNLRDQDSDAQEQGINPEESKHEPLVEMREVDVDVNNAEIIHFALTDIYDMPSEDNIQPRLLNEIDEKNTSPQMGTLPMAPDEKLDSQPIEVDTSIMDASIQKGVDAIGIVEHSVGNRADFQTGFSEVTDVSAQVTTVSLETGDQKNLSLNDIPMEEMGHEQHSLNENEVIDAPIGCDDKDTKSSCMLGGEDNIGSSILMELDVDGKYISFSDKENLEHEEVDPRGGTEAEVTGDYRAGNSGDYDNFVLGNDTEFLNVDDEEMAEEGDDMASAEDTCLLENSGWSSRTRAVAKYLQTLFDQEAVHGKKVLGMDNLLNGKTRKEASRMFFETLVLKTRDYVSVEQAKPFANINIKPRVKLMKSDF